MMLPRLSCILGIVLSSAVLAGDAEYVMVRMYALSDGHLYACTPELDGTMRCVPMQPLAPPRHCRDEGEGERMTCSPPGGELPPEVGT